jgi:hypothetical protein
MKGLAIASFLLGLIGFLFSFIFGLGMLPSILAVIFGIAPLVKKVLRSMAIPGLVMGLLGILISVSFLTQKPEHVIEQTMKGITQEREARPAGKVIKLGEGIRIGELLITFDSVRIAKTYDTGRYPMLPLAEGTIKEEAKPNYKLVVVKVKGKNVGKKKDGLWLSGTENQDYKIEVDKGYIYDPIQGESILNINLMPEETGSDDLVFEILESTTPVKLHALIKGKRFTVNLK